ncbi:hypothetical protein SODALDRAFT_361880 [Sodiomyces alkalinus F11]|uniref:Uncharacterized protein n=1 Tax=Sodiomyces alkalinus (strain CBS 110278 / VKM F-3762 / F11) TaxID=1314773 RepID=A0A3N2PR81_SODAK|nr:hypothetical protein SODALDRAFT_361880 [Sodiomyces alkalinus F11]ROT37022.1 hypothetical protein SODALDRAFT_361880 [Sodiomyces alkalinus F11]
MSFRPANPYWNGVLFEQTGGLGGAEQIQVYLQSLQIIWRDRLTVHSRHVLEAGKIGDPITLPPPMSKESRLFSIHMGLDDFIFPRLPTISLSFSTSPIAHILPPPSHLPPRTRAYVWVWHNNYQSQPQSESTCAFKSSGTAATKPDIINKLEPVPAQDIFSHDWITHISTHVFTTLHYIPYPKQNNIAFTHSTSYDSEHPRFLFLRYTNLHIASPPSLPVLSSERELTRRTNRSGLNLQDWPLPVSLQPPYGRKVFPRELSCIPSLGRSEVFYHLPDHLGTSHQTPSQTCLPYGRPTRAQRLVSNENDENSGTTRMTRAKAAAQGLDDPSQAKRALQTKKAVSTTTNGPQRKRAALDDVSNVGKIEAGESKKASSKVGLVSKAAQPTGVQKTQCRTTRTALSAKDPKKAVNVKRTGSGSGALVGVHKRKATSSAISVKDESSLDDGEPAQKKPHILDADKPIRTDENQYASADPVTETETQTQVAPKHVLPEGVQDLDTEDLDDPLMVAEYATEIFEYLRDLECKCIPNPNYMDHQDELEWKTRGILVDWLIEVHTRFLLLPETLFLAINLIDRFLSEKVVQLNNLQLVGVTAMFIAAKYEEVMSPHIGNFRKIADDGFTESEILSAEQFLLQTLNYDLSYPNPMNFLRRISKADNYDVECRTVGKYLIEIGLLDHRFLAFRPSHVAAGAMYLARLILDRGEWDATIAYYAGYTEEEVEPVVRLMVDYLARPVVHEAFFKKYASKKFLKASILARHWAKKTAAHFGITDTHLSLDQISAKEEDGHYDHY